MRYAHYRIRKARLGEGPAIRAMQEFSLRILGADYYRPEEVAAFIEKIGTMDYAVLAEGNFFVAVDLRGAIVGSGGWSRLKPVYMGAGASAAAPRDLATIRSMFVQPAAARLGIASAILRRAEADAAENGIRTLRLRATLSGLGFYEKRGYAAGERSAIDFGDGTRFGYVDMRKEISRQAQAA